MLTGNRIQQGEGKQILGSQTFCPALYWDSSMEKPVFSSVGKPIARSLAVGCQPLSSCPVR